VGAVSLCTAHAVLIIVAYVKRTDIEYTYSFDDDFDRFDDITRLTTAVDILPALKGDVLRLFSR